MHGRFSFCVSGAAKGPTAISGKEEAFEVGQIIAQAGHDLLTGATVGLPNNAAEGFCSIESREGLSIGISPAASFREHTNKYRLPCEAYDFIMYSGMHYVGRDQLLVTTSDAVVSVGGRIGTLHEFTIAYEAHIPIGILEGVGGTGEHVRMLLKAAGDENNPRVLFDTDPARLVRRLTALLQSIHAGDKL
ncbi:hypothetical protein CYG49_01040 [Candidatus Saccharibacteria bacterium]|nr:MAG: hypothetical protein CYG49_01040 [Candidatus Saccharibacteria bacterium]